MSWETSSANELQLSVSDERCEFHIVGVGASAGGLEALEKLFRHMPVDSGMAFVVVQHLSPDFQSHMHELLSRETSIPIHHASNGIAVEPNAIYLMNGFEAVATLRAKGYRRPIVALAAGAMKGDRDGYLVKPVDLSELERLLSKAGK